MDRAYTMLVRHSADMGAYDRNEDATRAASCVELERELLATHLSYD